MRGLGVTFSWLLILFFGLCTHALAAREVEPNNLAGQATLVDPRQEILGTIQDDFDFFKIILPEDGPVEIRIDNYPPGTQLRVGANGFSESDDELLEEKTNQGRNSLKMKFAAQERVGFIWLEFLFADTFCQNDWCVMQLVEDGPWYTLKAGIVPPEWQEREILEPPEYRMTIRQEALAPEEGAQTSSPPEPTAGYRAFNDPESGLTFSFPMGWSVGAGPKPGTWLVQPGKDAEHGMAIDLELLKRRDVPGSSAEKQLNLVERDLSAQGAEIRKRGQMKITNTEAPYLVAILNRPEPASPPGNTARMQVVVPLSDHYIRVGYFGPGEDYPKAVTDFETLLKSLGIKTAEPVKPAEK